MLPFVNGHYAMKKEELPIAVNLYISTICGAGKEMALYQSLLKSFIRKHLMQNLFTGVIQRKNGFIYLKKGGLTSG